MALDKAVLRAGAHIRGAAEVIALLARSNRRAAVAARLIINSIYEESV